MKWTILLSKNGKCWCKIFLTHFVCSEQECYLISNSQNMALHCRNKADLDSLNQNMKNLQRKEKPSLHTTQWIWYSIIKIPVRDGNRRLTSIEEQLKTVCNIIFVNYVKRQQIDNICSNEILPRKWIRFWTAKV